MKNEASAPEAPTSARARSTDRRRSAKAKVEEKQAQEENKVQVTVPVNLTKQLDLVRFDFSPVFLSLCSFDVL